jgi:hypothetical protein
MPFSYELYLLDIGSLCRIPHKVDKFSGARATVIVAANWAQINIHIK